MEESHGDAESGGCARCFVTSSNPSAFPWQRCCTIRTTRCTPSTALHGARTQPPGPGEGERVTRRCTRPSSGRLPRRSSSCTTRKTPCGRCGLGRSLTLCRMAWWSGTPWSTGSSRARSFRSSTLLCRSWGISRWSCNRRLSRRLLWSLCRLSPCPRSPWTASRSVLRYVVLRWQSSWWKCQLSLGMRWQSSPRRFIRGVRFVVFSLDRVQQRIWRKSLIFLLVKVSKVFSQVRVLPHRVDCMAALMKEFKGFFALFPEKKKVRSKVRTRGRNWVWT